MGLNGFVISLLNFLAAKLCLQLSFRGTKELTQKVNSSPLQNKDVIEST